MCWVESAPELKLGRNHLIGRVLEAGDKREVNLTIDVAQLAQLVG